MSLTRPFATEHPGDVRLSFFELLVHEFTEMGKKNKLRQRILAPRHLLIGPEPMRDASRAGAAVRLRRHHAHQW